MQTGTEITSARIVTQRELNINGKNPNFCSVGFQLPVHNKSNNELLFNKKFDLMYNPTKIINGNNAINTRHINIHLL